MYLHATSSMLFSNPTENVCSIGYPFGRSQNLVRELIIEECNPPDNNTPQGTSMLRDLSTDERSILNKLLSYLGTNGFIIVYEMPLYTEPTGKVLYHEQCSNALS